MICCVFDSINHVTRFSDWKRVFAGVRRHLSPGGCFIFDINTQWKLERHIAEPPWVHRFGKNLLIIDVTTLPNRESNWNIKAFEHLNTNRYVLHEEDIIEVSYQSGKIVAALRAHFAKVRVIDPGRKRATARSERLFFIRNKLDEIFRRLGQSQHSRIWASDDRNGKWPVSVSPATAEARETLADPLPFLNSVRGLNRLS